MRVSKDGKACSLFLFLVSIFALVCTAIPLWAATGNLETPTPGSFQSGIGLIRGWVCSASQVTIEVDGTDTAPAVYGEIRGDTQDSCGDTNNGFSFQINWNELGEGAHTVRALADNEEIGRATVTVATLGQAFLENAAGEFPLQPFPQNGQTTRLRWQERQQKFVLSSGSTPTNSGTSPRVDARLENPDPGSFQSGVGLIRGWVCSATQIEVFLDGGNPVPAVYQELREDTREVCGDSNNGFSIQVNWNDIGDGPHTIRVVADGSEVGQATFTVVTLGLGSFPLGLAGSFILPNFPTSGLQTSVAWQESQQNFVITGARYPGIEEGLCKTNQGLAVDSNNVQAAISWSNPCLLSGNLAVLHVQVPRRPSTSATPAAVNTISTEREPRAASTENFFLCATSITIQQQGRTFSASDFRLVDLAGNEVCREIPVNTELDAILQVNAQSDLNFNAPFEVFYNNQSLVNFPSTALNTGQPTLTLSTEQLDFGSTSATATQPRSTRAGSEATHNNRESRNQTATFQDKTFTIRNDGNGALIGGMTLIANGSGGKVFHLLSESTLNLSPGQSFNVIVRYSPKDNSSVTGSVRISTNAGVKSVLLQGSGLGNLPQPQPRLQVSPNSINFRMVEVSKSRDGSFTILNTGQGTLTGSISVAAPFSLLSNGTFSVEPGQNFPVGVRFAPTTAGNFTGTATVTSNGGSATVALSGMSERFRLCVDPPTLDFGTVDIGKTKDLTVTVKNCGNSPLTGSVTAPLPFNVIAGGNFTLTENQEQEVTLRFAPTKSGTFNTSATVTTNNPSTTLTLKGVAPDAAPIVTPQLCLDPAVPQGVLAFGPVGLGVDKDLSFTVKNCGTGTLAGTVTTVAPFSIAAGGQFSLTEGQTQTIAVRFRPTIEGTFSENAQVTTSVGSATVRLTGSGVREPKLCVNPTDLDFGTVSTSEGFESLDFTIENCGGGLLTGGIIDPCPSGECDTPFQVSFRSNLNFNLLAGQRQPITVDFNPFRGGVFNDSIPVNSNGGSLVVNLRGIGVPPSTPE